MIIVYLIAIFSWAMVFYLDFYIASIFTAIWILLGIYAAVFNRFVVNKNPLAVREHLETVYGGGISVLVVTMEFIFSKIDPYLEKSCKRVLEFLNRKM